MPGRLPWSWTLRQGKVYAFPLESSRSRPQPGTSASPTRADGGAPTPRIFARGGFAISKARIRWCGAGQGGVPGSSEKHLGLEHRPRFTIRESRIFEKSGVHGNSTGVARTRHRGEQRDFHGGGCDSLEAAPSKRSGESGATNGDPRETTCTAIDSRRVHYPISAF